VNLGLDGRKALVTAAAQGIGEAVVRQLAQSGATVVAVDASGERLIRACQDLPQVTPVCGDLTSAEFVQALAAAHPDTGILVNVVGYVHHGTILDCDEAAWQRSIDLNMTTMYRLTRAVLPGMLERGGGRIINVASVVSTLKAVPNRFAYAATKGAVIALTKSVAADFVRQGIRCNAICPGTIDTPSLHERLAASGDYAANLQAFLQRQPLGRFGRASEVAAMALYLASDASDFVTGAVMVCDGGMTL
jgi:2-keto-3-deoxy-L-fuconate dehydrogenase